MLVINLFYIDRRSYGNFRLLNVFGWLLVFLLSVALEILHQFEIFGSKYEFSSCRLRDGQSTTALRLLLEVPLKHSKDGRGKGLSTYK